MPGITYAHTRMAHGSRRPTRIPDAPRTSSYWQARDKPDLSSDVLEAARQLDINISQVCDSYLRELVAASRVQVARESCRFHRCLQCDR